jgi:hypothetical protein
MNNEARIYWNAAAGEMQTKAEYYATRIVDKGAAPKLPRWTGSYESSILDRDEAMLYADAA